MMHAALKALLLYLAIYLSSVPMPRTPMYAPDYADGERRRQVQHHRRKMKMLGLIIVIYVITGTPRAVGVGRGRGVRRGTDHVHPLSQPSDIFCFKVNRHLLFYCLNIVSR
jgi:hypothetical protein